MKKITFLFLMMLGGLTMQAQNLLSNGDFEQGMVTWFGNAFNVQTDGGNSFNQSDNEISANPFDVNLSHPVELTGGTTYTLSFDAATSMEDGSRTIIAGIGLNEGGFEAAIETVTVTSDLQTFTLTLTPPLGSANSRALFDLGADDGVLVIDNVVLTVDGMTGGNDDELLSNGDFELGMVTWFGNAFNVQTDGGNNFNQSDNEVSANPFDVNLSHPVELVGGTTYVFSFDAATSMEDGTRTIIAGIGLNEGGFEAAIETVTVTSELQTFTFELTPPLGSANSRALFDLGADDGLLILDNVSLMLADSGNDLGIPTAVPDTPTELQEDVVSIFSETFTSAVSATPTTFGVNNNTAEIITAEGNEVYEFVIVDGDFQGFQFDVQADLTEMENLHYDIWIEGEIPVGNVFNTTVSQHGGGHLTGQTVGYVHTNATLSAGQEGQWVSFDIPFSDFAPDLSTGDRDIISELVFTYTNFTGANNRIFVDNIYFWRQSLSVDDFAATDLTVFPNPSINGVWNIETVGQNITSVEIYDISGRRVSALTPNTNTITIDSSNFSTGMYFATVSTENGTQSVKLVKR